MCGIAGILTNRHRQAETVRRVDGMIAAVRHRGPDGHNVVAVGDHHGNCLVLGHARLSILDLSDTSAQPMLDLATGSWVVYNGEIYNFRELRHELESYGHRFVSTGDTEVLLKAMVQWNRGALKKFQGMFAFAFWDGRGRELILARDTFGIKPLLFSRTADGFVFASELKSIEASGLVPFSLNPEAVTSYLTYGCVIEPETVASKVWWLSPGQMLTVDSDGRIKAPAKFSTVSDLLQTAAVSQRPKAADASEVRHALTASIKDHLVSDVPIGISLSGGIDSSLLAMLAADTGNVDLRTLTVSFPDERFSELKYATSTAKRINAKAEVILLHGTKVLELVFAALEAADQPTVDGVNSYIVARAARHTSLGRRILRRGATECGGERAAAGGDPGAPCGSQSPGRGFLDVATVGG